MGGLSALVHWRGKQAAPGTHQPMPNRRGGRRAIAQSRSPRARQGSRRAASAFPRRLASREAIARHLGCGGCFSADPWRDPSIVRRPRAVVRGRFAALRSAARRFPVGSGVRRGFLAAAHLPPTACAGGCSLTGLRTGGWPLRAQRSPSRTTLGHRSALPRGTHPQRANKATPPALSATCGELVPRARPRPQLRSSLGCT
jgi:hypothetical protein